MMMNKMKKIDKNECVDDLCEILDRETDMLQLLQTGVQQMDQALMQRDHSRLERILSDVEIICQERETLLERLVELRNQLESEPLPQETAQARVPFLERIPAENRQSVERKVGILSVLSTELHQSLLKVGVLVGENQRINHLLLRALFPESGKISTYGEDGAKQWRAEGSLLNQSY